MAMKSMKKAKRKKGKGTMKGGGKGNNQGGLTFSHIFMLMKSQIPMQMKGTPHSERLPKRNANHFCMSDDLKNILLQRIFALQPSDDTKDSEPAPVMPVDGIFKGGVEQYKISWQKAICCDFSSQVLQEARRATSSALRAKFIHDVGLSIELLTGSWKSTSHLGLSHISCDNGVLWYSGGDETRRWPLKKDGVGDWRSACFGDRLFQYFLRDWNTIVEQCNNEGQQSNVEMERIGKLQSGSIVLIVSSPSQRDEAVLSRMGIVENRYPNRAIVRAAVEVEQSLGHRHAEIRVLSAAGMVPALRELHAVKEIHEIPQELLGQILGSSLPTKVSLKTIEGRWRLPCLSKLNESQIRSVETAESRDVGFTLIWGPPGTGKSATLLALVNALHVQEYAKMYKAIEDIALGKNIGKKVIAQLAAAARLAPRILVTASSNSAVESLIERVQAKKFMGKNSNEYEPWGMIRVGTDKGERVFSIDLDARVNELLAKSHAEVKEQLESVRAETKGLIQSVLQLRENIRNFQSGLSDKSSDSSRARAIRWVSQLVHDAEKWMQSTCWERRWTILDQYQKQQVRTDGKGQGKGKTYHAARQQLECSFMESAHIVFSTLSSAARLVSPDSGQPVKSFGAIVIDEAAQATETSVLVPISTTRSKRVVLMGDDRQLPPTVFASNSEQHFTMRSLFERLRIVGHRAELLNLQYRMSPQISSFPRSYFYGGELHDAPDVAQRTALKTHRILPPLVFVNLASSQVTYDKGSWMNWEEAQVCARIAERLCIKAKKLGELYMAEDIGVITGYRAQQVALQHAFKARSVNADIRTVDGYQGREREVIVVSTVRAPEHSRQVTGRVGFLADERRVNVAITRAKSILVVVGHSGTLCKVPAWAALLSHIRKYGAFYESSALR